MQFADTKEYDESANYLEMFLTSPPKNLCSFSAKMVWYQLSSQRSLLPPAGGNDSARHFQMEKMRFFRKLKACDFFML